MFKSLWQDIKREYENGNMITKIILVNIAIFVAINIMHLFFPNFGGPINEKYVAIRNMFCMSSSWQFVLSHPWVIITNMFLHEGFMHILWNMLFLYWFGRIVGDLIGNQRVLPIYLLGGLVAGFTFFISINVLGYGGPGVHYALGASGAVMAIVAAAGTISPDYNMRLLLIGDVKLKYVVAVLVFLDIIATSKNVNTGGAFAHLGGAAFGWFFVRQLREGTDYSVPVNRFFNWVGNIFKAKKSKSKMRVSYKNPNYQQQASSDTDTFSHQEKLDSILDKIRENGYEKLSEEEKEFLYNASRK